VAVIAGTGSIAVGKSADGRSARAGGWGHIFGDEGSGYGTAVAALRRVAGRFDGRLAGGSEGDPLTSAICRATGIDDPTGLVSAIYAPEFDRAKIAGLAACVVEAAEADPSVARDLLEPAGIALAGAAVAVAERLDLPREGLPLALAGGFLLSSQAVSRAMLGEMERVGYRVVPNSVEEPVAGAIALAKRALSQ
jgi:N-acetylglucosamine kinase-like BadF-type ATPase